MIQQKMEIKLKSHLACENTRFCVSNAGHQGVDLNAAQAII
jgi:hypothetical protein